MNRVETRFGWRNGWRCALFGHRWRKHCFAYCERSTIHGCTWNER